MLNKDKSTSPTQPFNGFILTKIPNFTIKFVNIYENIPLILKIEELTPKKVKSWRKFQ
jgi:hypothetical protein